MFEKNYEKYIHVFCYNSFDGICATLSEKLCKNISIFTNKLFCNLIQQRGLADFWLSKHHQRIVKRVYLNMVFLTKFSSHSINLLFIHFGREGFISLSLYNFTYYVLIFFKLLQLANVYSFISLIVSIDILKRLEHP